jgi:PAT family beta-lactamase induction signal transducer AmpG
MALTAKFSDVGRSLKQPASWVLLGLGFSSALPFLLVGATLGFWLRTANISLTAIGFMSWTGLFYGTKILWAPWMDKVRLPGLYHWLGQRRSYMLLSQLAIAGGLVAMAWIGPGQLLNLCLVAAFVTFAAASQEIAVDAWRVEQTNSEADQALNPSLYSFGYKTGIIVTNSLILLISKRIGWPAAYECMGGLMLIGMLTTLLAHRTEVETRPHAEKRDLKALFIEPFASFYREHKGTATLILLVLALYRLPDYLLAPVSSMYVDTGLDMDAIGAMRGTIGLVAAYSGVAIGGAILLILGLRQAFFLGALVGPVANLSFSWLSLAAGNLGVFAFALISDDLGDGISDTALVAFMTRMTGRDHTLTHYALMYSVSALSGKILKGFSGAAIDALKPSFGLFPAYAVFFGLTAAMAIPTLILCWCLHQKGVFSGR